MNTDIDSLITGVSVTWNTKDLIEKAISSIRKFHPTMHILIADGSEKKDECYSFLDEIKGKYLTVNHFDYNIGHGRGLHFGLQKAQTPYVLYFDSDIEMVKSPLEGMLAMMEDNTYGVGYIEYVARDGHDFGVFPRHNGQIPVKYMHPYFQLIQVKEAKKYQPPIHHGAPCIATMLDIHDRGLSDIVLKEYKCLGHTNGCGMSWKPCEGEYVIHNVMGFGGTGKMRVAKGLPHIEGQWANPMGTRR